MLKSVVLVFESEVFQGFGTYHWHYQYAEENDLCTETWVS